MTRSPAPPRPARALAAAVLLAAALAVAACSESIAQPSAPIPASATATSGAAHRAAEASSSGDVSRSASANASAQPGASASASAGVDSEWPPAFYPATDDRRLGQSAAHHLIGYTTSYPTVTQQPAWAAKYHGVVNGVNTTQRVVAITFDDGPTPNTAEICDELTAFGDHATFFWVGARVNQQAVDYSLGHGEELANHTWNHPNMWKLSSQEASAEIGLTNARIGALGGSMPLWFRSPYNRLFNREYKEVRAHGLLYANYSITSIDWQKNATPFDIISKIDGGLHPGGIILMHDSPTHDPASWLPNVLTLLKTRGYRGVTLSELAQMGTPVLEPVKYGSKGLPY